MSDPTTPPEPVEARDLTAEQAVARVIERLRDKQTGSQTYNHGWSSALDAVLTALRADTARVPEGLRELSDAATPGPWRTGDETGLRDGLWSEGSVTTYDPDDGPGYLVAWCHADNRADEDAAFIAAAANHVRAALAISPEGGSDD